MIFNYFNYLKTNNFLLDVIGARCLVQTELHSHGFCRFRHPTHAGLVGSRRPYEKVGNRANGRKGKGRTSFSGSMPFCEMKRVY